MCPHCKVETQFIRKGFYLRRSDGKKVQKFQCVACQKWFSGQTTMVDYRHRKRHLNGTIYRHLAKGTSERAAAYLIGVNRKTITRRIERFALAGKTALAKLRKEFTVEKIQFDELESFEHTKCKPLTAPIAVNRQTRQILSVRVGQIAAKGKLAEVSRKKYGRRTMAAGRVNVKNS